MKSIKDVIRERMDTRLKSVYSAIAICLSYKHHGYYGYEEKRVNEEVLNNILIREDDSDWREPLVEA